MARYSLMFFMTLLLLSSCGYDDKSRLALRYAGSNRAEIEKVLERYRREGDREKVQAVKFLLGNLPYHSFLYSDGLEEAKDWFRQMRERPSDEFKRIRDSIADNVEVNKGLRRIYDVQVLDSAYLCDNIDMAFKVWRGQPWGKNVNFEMFCKYILPHRISDEVPLSWRKDYYEEYDHLLDEFRMSDTLDIADPLVAYRFLVNKIPIVLDQIYTSMTPVSFPHVGADYVKYNTGTCKEFCDFLIYVCRSVGIPCALNNILNDGHCWITLWDKDGNEYVADNDPEAPVINSEAPLNNRMKLRVLRNSYEVNHDEMLRLRKGRVELPEFFRIPLFEDVTDHYTPDYAEEVMIPDSLFTEKVAPGDVIYLCSLSRNIWRVEDYTVKGLFRARFNGVQTGNIVCAARMGEDGLTSVTEPFVVGKKPDEYVFFKPSRKKETVILKSKYHLEGDDGKYGEIMRNGVFEGSQTPDFQHPDTLAIIQSRPVRQTTRLNTYRQSVEPHKFVRYKGTYGSSSIAAEIGFYGHDGLPVEYDRILGVQSEKARRALAHAFDSDPSTSYSAEDGWCGLELSTPVHVHSVTFTPRNRVNYIYAGDEYELFYYHGSWISLGRMVADSDSLLYHNVPVGSLLFLKNHTTGVNEMAFTYEDGIQNFLGYTDRNSRMESFPRVSEEDWSCSHTFLTPEDDWVTPLYDDSDWEIGLGPFGLKRGCRTEWSSRNLYVRYRFDMRSDSGAVSDHILKGYVTSNCHIYLNGKEIGILGATDEEFELHLSSELFYEGENVFAIKCINRLLSDECILDIEVL